MKISIHSLLSNNNFDIYYNDKLKFAGIDVGPCYVFKRLSDTFIVAKRKGHMTWGGVGYQDYAPVIYYFIEYKNNEPYNELGRRNYMYKCGNVWEVEGVKRINKELDTIINRIQK